MIGPETLKRLVDHALDTLRAAVESNRAVDGKAKLAGDLHLVADGSERLADQLLVDVGSINLSRIEERDPLLVSGPDDIDALRLVGGRSIIGADAHAAKAYFRDVERPEFACFHDALLSGCLRFVQIYALCIHVIRAYIGLGPIRRGYECSGQPSRI
jgi:hypothetical protein